jgi:predicted metal-dependent HD superfamily phosphohydrolase
MPPAAARVAARWDELARACWPRAAGGENERERDRLLAAYAAPGRHYHDLRHIDSMLALSAAHRGALRDASAVDLAILYHDAVYEPARKDNEQASAAMARQALTALGVAAPLVDKVARYIEATEHLGASAPADTDPDLDHLIDFDLSILAAEPADYDAYAAAIRREYAIYPDLLYRPGRAKALAKLIAMPKLCRVPALAAMWEAKARGNLERELGGLGAR